MIGELLPPGLAGDGPLDPGQHLIAGHPPVTDPMLCRGTMISRAQYLPDIREDGYLDARLPPHGRMASPDVAHWTAAIGTIR